MQFQGRRPILIALAAQTGAAAAVIATVQAHAAAAGGDLPLWLKLAIACAVAAAVARILGARGAWWLLQPALPLLFVGALQLDLPVWVPAAVLALLALSLGNSLTDRVPLYLSNRAVLDALCREIPAENPVRVIDLGAGLGAVPRALAYHNRHPDSRFEGVESAPLVWLASRFLSLGADRRVRLRFGSLWDTPLSGYDMVYVFLSPHPMAALYAKAEAEMPADSKLISNSFPVPGRPAGRRVPLNSGRSDALLIWHMRGDGAARE
jgi:hypothetical protein